MSEEIKKALTTLTYALLCTRMPDMFLCSVSKVMYGKICALPLQFDFQFENVFMFFFSIFFGPSLDHIKQPKESNLHFR